MQIPLNTPARKWMVGGATLAMASIYIALCGILFLAAWFGAQAEPKTLQRAARLDPGNAEYRNHLGRYYELVARDPLSAIPQYIAAVQLNPHSARYWFDLASAYQVQGDTARQAEALEHAIQADPTTPDVAWEAANLYLVQGQEEKALREFGVVMANDTSLIFSSVQFCWRIRPDIDVLLRDVIPPRSEAYVVLLDFLMSKQETAATEKVWDSLIRSGQTFERRRMFEYFRYLIAHKEVEEASLVWRQGARQFGLASYQPSSVNLVVNGSFSLDILNGGFDWQYQKQNSVELSLDPREFHDGNKSLLVTFDGPRVNDAGIFQYVAVQPGTTYTVSAYYKSADLQGAGGPHITVQDMYKPATIYYESEEMKEAGFWKSVAGEFTTDQDCRLVVLHIRRLPEGSPIRGKLWVDDFHIARK